MNALAKDPTLSEVVFGLSFGSMPLSSLNVCLDKLSRWLFLNQPTEQLHLHAGQSSPSPLQRRQYIPEILRQQQ